MDMWYHFIKAVREHCPHALIVFVKYHLIASYNRNVIDETRQALRKNNQKIILNTKYIKTADKLEKLLEINKNFSLAYILRDKLKELFEYQNPIRLKNTSY